MATLSSETPNLVQRRIVLIDFDWQDADLLPELLRRPGVSVRLVAGEKSGDPGIRVAELCGLPRTVDLADLTREIFDLALVSERSSRRTQVESLLLALGTPCSTPQSFLNDAAPSPVHDPPAIEAPIALHAAAFEHVMGGEAVDRLLQQALPDLTDSAPTAPQPVILQGQPKIVIGSLENFPSPEDRLQLEDALRTLAEVTNAGAAELHAGDGDSLSLVAHVGPQDALLKGLVELAMELGTPQVVSRLCEPNKGKAWGAWPFRTTQHCGVLAAAAIDPAEGWQKWQGMVEELRTTWDERERVKAGAAFPLTPQRQSGWLTNDEFRARLELSLERNRHDRMRFTLHRLEFPPVFDAVNALCGWLPQQIRDTDCICRPETCSALLLTAGPSEAFVHVRRRLMALWEVAWRDSGSAPPAPPITSRNVALAGPEDAEAFLAAAGSWLGQTR